jgi:oxygen-independent coproporphyrinogen-3 oxidase
MSIESSPFEVKEVLGEEERLLEIAYTSARLSNGFPLAWLFPDGRSYEIAEAYLASLVSDDLLDRRSFQEGRVVFTEKGREVLDGLMGEIWSRSRP